MPMQFNPHTAFLRGMDLGSPTTSQGGINNLLQMQQNTLNGLIDTIGNIGKTSRTNTVNDLIARGGLEGLNEAQAQAKIAQTAGGTLTPEGQMQVDKLLQLTGKKDDRNFSEKQQKDLFGHQTSERIGRQTFDAGENATDRLYKTSEREKGQDFIAGESAKDRANRLAIEKMGNNTQMKIASLRQTESKEVDPFLFMTNGVGMSPEQKSAFQNLSPQEQLTFLDDNGKLKKNIAWTVVPEERNDKGDILRPAYGRFEDRLTGRRVKTSGYKPAKKEEKWLGLF